MGKRQRVYNIDHRLCKPCFLRLCNQQEQLRQLPYPVPIGLRQEDLDLDLEEEESAEDSEDLEEEGETLFNDDSDPMEASSVQDLAAVNESV